MVQVFLQCESIYVPLRIYISNAKILHKRPRKLDIACSLSSPVDAQGILMEQEVEVLNSFNIKGNVRRITTVFPMIPDTGPLCFQAYFVKLMDESTQLWIYELIVPFILQIQRLHAIPLYRSVRPLPLPSQAPVCTLSLWAYG